MVNILHQNITHFSVLGSGEGGGVGGKDAFSGKETFLPTERRGSSGILFDALGKLCSAGFSFCSVFHGMTIVRGMTMPWKMSMKRKLNQDRRSDF